jgi:hypothetical protein
MDPDKQRVTMNTRRSSNPRLKRGFINAIRLKRDEVPGFAEYPFCIPVNRHERMLELLLNAKEAPNET